MDKAEIVKAIPFGHPMTPFPQFPTGEELIQYIQLMNTRKQKSREYKRKYTNKPENKARIKEYNSRPEVKAKKKEHTNRPEYKAQKREYDKAYNSIPENKARRNYMRKEHYRRTRDG